MDVTVANPLPAFGFLTVVEHDEYGFFGGYLVLSELGRPLEFHCSTPVFPTQAQRILYGSTLRPYVLGEIIGQTLVNKAQLPVHAVFTDLEEMLSLGLVWDGVLACVQRDPLPAVEIGPVPTPSQGIAPPTQSTEANSPYLELAGYSLRGSETCHWAAEELRQRIAPLVSHVELSEPFDRIREAIQEAQRVTSTAAEEPPAGEANEQSVAA